MKYKYLCYYIDAIQAIVPSPVRTKSTYSIELYDNEDIYEKLEKANSNTLMEIVDYIELNEGTAKLEDIREYFSGLKIDYYLKKLQEMGIITKHQSIGNKVNKKIEKLLYLNEAAVTEIKKNAPKQREIVEILSRNPGMSFSKLREQCSNCDSSVRTLAAKGCIKIVEKEEYRKVEAKVIREERHELTVDQHSAVAKIHAFFNEGKNVLLYGVTGSGKTEVYLELIEESMKNGRDSIMLVPEISLTPQMVSRFKNRFGDNVAVLHSSLSEGEKYDEWRKIKSGLVKVAIGARSAVFAPMPNPGLIIIDEEHESTYKQDDHLRYHAREVALKRAQQSGSVVILGSATPSLESYVRAESGGIYRLLKLPRRIGNYPLPPVQIIDMREEQ
jgi:primosomal protein N' (replication factor Y)